MEELGNTYSCDFSEDNSGGARLMAKILFLKFPKELKGEMIKLIGRRIPSHVLVAESIDLSVQLTNLEPL